MSRVVIRNERLWVFFFRCFFCGGLFLPALVSAQTLTHRYSFFDEPNGSTVATDRVASANGTLQGAAAIAGGQLVLNGAQGTYLNLPAGIVNSSYSAVTIETWVDFGSLPVNCFFYGFGNTDGSGAGKDYIFCAPQGGRIAITGSDPGWQGEENANSGVNWSGQTHFHIVAVYNPPANQVVLYTNGVLAAINTSVTTPLSAVDDVYSYVGRSLYTSDPYAPLNVSEFRIWNGALSAQQVALDDASGPAQIITDPGALLSLHLQVTNTMRAGETQSAALAANFASATNVNLFTYGQPTVISDNTNVVVVSASGLVRAVVPGTAANIIATYGGLSATQNVTVTGFATNQFVFDSFGDGFWTIVNRGNSNVLVAGPGGSTQEIFANGAAEQQFEVLYNLQNGTFRLRQRSSWFCINAQNNSPKPGGAVTIYPFYSGIGAQQWYLVAAGGGWFRIFNAASNLVLETDNGAPAKVTLAAPSASPFQLWQFNYQTHYPKKGTGGWVGQFGTSWAYDWAYNSYGPSSLPAPIVYEPMQWGNWNVDTSTYNAWHTTPKPVYLLGFNEPDNSIQANMTTNQAIALWPQLQAMNVPLVSPAMQHTFDAWAYNFFTLVTNNNLRVDYTAVHLYQSPNASALINNLYAVYTTWGRPVWLTEFSPVDWNGNGGWTENDDYNFLAEFMWMAEDLPWLKRYAIFLFSGTNPLPPWQSTTAGYRGNFFLADGVTLAPYGELYAAWDASRTLQTRTPYFIHNLGTSFRLTSTNASTPQPATIYARDASAQWALLPSPNANQYYVVSLKDGRRLRNNGGTPDLAPVGTTNASAQWWFNGPDSKGYYYIDNLSASQSIRATGTAPAISFSMINDPAPSAATQWRLIKPYQPVAIVTAAPPSLSIAYSSQSAALSWSGSGAFYNVYRSTVSGGVYEKIAGPVTNLAYFDDSLQNGTAYYYVVTALNILGEESTGSAEVVARPASTIPQPVGASVVNAGARNGIQFDWAADHTGWRLLMNTNSLANANAWVPVSGSESTNRVWLPFDAAPSEVFFRLVYP